MALVLLISFLFSVIGPVTQAWASSNQSASRRARLAKVIKQGKGRRVKVTPSPTPSVPETPQPTATPTPSPSPSVSATPTPTPTPSVSATPAPAPAASTPRLLLTQSDVDAIRARLAQGAEPEKSAFDVFMSGRVKTAAAATPQVFAGPQTIGGVGTPMELALDRDGSSARNLALAYALTGDTTYATKARGFLVAWAAGNTPTTYADCGDKWGGSYQSHGAFMFAYAYDLTAGSGVYSSADKTAIEAWMKRFTAALDTYMAYLRTEFGVRNPGYTTTYVWDATKKYYAYENYVGGDNALLTQAARLALARVSGDQAVVDSILNDSSNILSLESMSKASLSPRNDGDGVAGHPVPTPQVDVYKKPTAGRGGTIDYMTYNTRVCDVMLEIAENAGWDATRTATLRSRLDHTWDYLARFFGPNAEAPFIVEDDPSETVCVPRFALAYHELGDPAYLAILQTGDRSGYYESQLVGPVTLTHSIR